MRCGEGASTQGAMAGGRVLDPAALGQALRNVLARSEISSTRALIAASDTIASFRVMTFPTGATNQEIDAALRSQLPLSSERMVIRHVDVLTGRPERTIYATVWDRSQVQAIAETARRAGLEPMVVELKSLCVARAVPVSSYLLLDMSAEPCEVLLVDEQVPRVWHSFRIEAGGDLAAGLAAGLKPVLGFYRNPGSAGFGPESPILVRSEQVLPSLMAGRLEGLTGHSVYPLPEPKRIDQAVRFSPYLTCIGLVMRRRV